MVVVVVVVVVVDVVVLVVEVVPLVDGMRVSGDFLEAKRVKAVVLGEENKSVRAAEVGSEAGSDPGCSGKVGLTVVVDVVGSSLPGAGVLGVIRLTRCDLS